MIYIGCHVTEDINDSYMGSGTNIKSAIKQHGLNNFHKEILFIFDNQKEMLDKEAELVDREFIAKKDTYNICIGGGTFLLTDTVSVKDDDNNYFRVHKTDPRYLSREFVGVNMGLLTVKTKDGVKYFNVNTDDDRIFSGELIPASKELFLVKDKNDVYIMVSKTDPRYLSGEFIAASSGYVSVKDNSGNTMRVKIDDPRYLSGELVGVTKGKKLTQHTKDLISSKNKDRLSGDKNPQYGTRWIYNIDIRQNKKVKPDELSEYLNNNWILGYNKEYNKKKYTII